MTTKKQPEQQVDIPSQLLDAYGNPGLVAAGGLIESAWGNAVVNRSIQTFPSKAAMDAVTPAAGRFAVTGDNNTVWLGDGTRWRATAFGNVMAFRVLGGPPGHAIPPDVNSTVVWTGVRTDPNGIFIGGTSLQVPAGWAGRWRFEWGVDFPDGGAVGVRNSFLNASANRLGEQQTYRTAGPVRQSGSASIVLAEGAQANIIMFHDDPAGLAVNASPNQYFAGTYTGAY